MEAHRLTRLCPLTALAALTVVLLVACGGSNNPSSSSSSGLPHKAFAASNVYKYPACMRNHGVTDFPDPQVSGHRIVIQVNPSITDAPAFKSAQTACAYLLPAASQSNGAGAAQRDAPTEGLLEFAACMRGHGFPSFPDPNSQDQLTPEMITQAGINLRQPAVLQAGDACVSASHGEVTKADVARAVAGAGASGAQGPGTG